MKKDNIVIETFGDRKIAIAGIGKLYYQEGFPIAISISELKKKGIDVSMLHVADELLKNGWTKERVVATIETAFDDDIEDSLQYVNMKSIRDFCSPFCSYEEQREMIFQYLFGFSSKEAIGDRSKIDSLTKIMVNNV